MPRNVLLPILVVLLGAPGSEVFASPVLYSVTGTVGVSTIPGVAVGAPMAGSFVYDPDAPLETDVPGFFRVFSPTSAMISATVGGAFYDASLTTEEVDNDLSLIDYFPTIPNGVYDAFNILGNPLSFALLDADAGFYDSFAGLPATLPLVDFEYAVLGLFLQPPSPDDPVAPYTLGLVAVSRASVPEPASTTLLLVGVAAALRARRRRVT